MKTVSYQQISDPEPTEIIVELEPGESCPRCGAPLEVGCSACSHCKTPVREMLHEG
jgi:hypothetical protein